MQLEGKVPANGDLQLYGHLPVPICMCEGCRLVLGNVWKRNVWGKAQECILGRWDFLTCRCGTVFTECASTYTQLFEQL